MRTPPLQRRSIRNIQTANINIKHDNNTHPSTTINSVYESHYVFLSSPSPSWGWSSVELADCAAAVAPVGSLSLHVLYEPQWTHLSPTMWNGTLHFCYTHTHMARLTNYTFCMSRSEHTWARWCGTAHTRPDSQTTHVVWAAVNTPLLLLLPYFLY